MTYELCGNCLHSKSSHTKHNGHFMYCVSCFKLCNLSEYEINHKPSGSIHQDGVMIKLE